MKNLKRIFAAAAFCAAIFVGYNTYKQATMTEQERLIQANLEALSRGEGSTKTCRWSRVFDSSGCAYHNCVNNGDGDLCECGDTKD